MKELKDQLSRANGSARHVLLADAANVLIYNLIRAGGSYPGSVQDLRAWKFLYHTYVGKPRTTMLQTRLDI